MPVTLIPLNGQRRGGEATKNAKLTSMDHHRGGGGSGAGGGANGHLNQVVMRTLKSMKREKVMQLVKEGGKNIKTIIFCGSKKGTDFLSAFLATRDVSVNSIHGDRRPYQRLNAINQFINGDINVLVATGVSVIESAIDEPLGTELVINYEIPNQAGELVHRSICAHSLSISKGVVTLYDDKCNGVRASCLTRMLRIAGQPVPEFLTQAPGCVCKGG